MKSIKLGSAEKNKEEEKNQKHACVVGWKFDMSVSPWISCVSVYFCVNFCLLMSV